MTQLLHAPRSWVLWLLCAVALVGLLVLGAVLLRLERRLHPYGIVQFEFASSPERAREMMKAWGEPGMLAARRSLQWDFLFIPAYASLAWAVTLLVARAAPGDWAWFGLALTVAPLLAGAVDVVENFALLSVLKRPGDPPAALLSVAAVMAGVKFSLLFACLVYAAASLLSWLSLQGGPPRGA